MDAKNLAELYDLPPVEWSVIERRLEAGFSQAPGSGGPDRHTCWLATLNADGGPHVTAVGAIWEDGAFWFETGPSTRKGRNVTRDPRCSLSIATDGFDLTVEGMAERTTDPAVVARLAERWNDEGWPCVVDERGVALTAPFSAPSAGSPPWHVYKVVPRSAFGLITTGDGGAMRWTFQ
ncbi:MAG TPA: pyridoxamine 5'-phosphate oxidase family protein [Mycobacteriales bacterium]|nr:pyridoxamine 5'-phosphate oxidase family protein [Mycobacteriales bacterium]